jgi:hypothetical protein
VKRRTKPKPRLVLITERHQVWLARNLRGRPELADRGRARRTDPSAHVGLPNLDTASWGTAMRLLDALADLLEPAPAGEAVTAHAGRDS